jgi:hypothetical protein
MWLFSAIGFYSVVALREHPDAVVVRARAREDLEKLREHVLPDLEIVETPQRDYAYRAVVARDEWGHAAEQLALAIDYPNFKNAVARRQGPQRAARYTEVWSVMYELQLADRQNRGSDPDFAL